MIFWIKKLAFILGVSAFFAILLINIGTSENPFDPFNVLSAVIKALLGAGLCWFCGFIIGDILFKGVFTDIEIDRTNLLEGGLLQRIDVQRQRSLPGGPDMPLTRESVDLIKALKDSRKKKSE